MIFSCNGIVYRPDGRNFSPFGPSWTGGIEIAAYDTKIFTARSEAYRSYLAVWNERNQRINEVEVFEPSYTGGLRIACDASSVYAVAATGGGPRRMVYDHNLTFIRSEWIPGADPNWRQPVRICTTYPAPAPPPIIPPPSAPIVYGNGKGFDGVPNKSVIYLNGRGFNLAVIREIHTLLLPLGNFLLTTKYPHKMCPGTYVEAFQESLEWYENWVGPGQPVNGVGGTAFGAELKKSIDSITERAQPIRVFIDIDIPEHQLAKHTAHEVCHVYASRSGLPVHDSRPNNLMGSPPGNRLENDQVVAMRNNLKPFNDKIVFAYDGRRLA